jgi:hypothetical protein
MQNATETQNPEPRSGIYNSNRKMSLEHRENRKVRGWPLCDHSMKTWNMALELDTRLLQPSTTHSLNGLVLGMACFSLPLAEALMERLVVHSPQ